MANYATNSTEGASSQCINCHALYYGFVTWTYIDGHGPYCEHCMKQGVTVPWKNSPQEKLDNPADSR